MDAYTEAHLFVAAIRVCEYKQSSPPSIEDVCELLGYSVEHGHTICRKMKKKNVVKTLEDAFSFKLSVADYLAIETFSKEPEKEDSLAKEIEAFKAKKKDMDAEVKKIQDEMEKKKKAQFADIEARLKAEIEKNK